MDAPGTGRPRQRQRTRKDLLQAATRLVRQGRRPGLEEIAEDALRLGAIPISRQGDRDLLRRVIARAKAQGRGEAP